MALKVQDFIPLPCKSWVIQERISLISEKVFPHLIGVENCETEDRISKMANCIQLNEV